MQDHPWQESKVIAHIKKRRARKHFHPRRLGLGDDAFAFDEQAQAVQLVTMDAMVEKVHWKKNWCSLGDVAAKLVAVNVSDIAAMGGLPQRAFLTVCIPPQETQHQVNHFLDGLIQALHRYHIDLAGGDTTVSSGPWMITLGLQGQSRGPRLLTRTQARPGDLIVMTGDAGAAAAGRCLLDKPSLEQPWRRVLINRFLFPEPRLEAGALLATSGRVFSAMDCSDGLARDVRQLAAGSQVGAVLEAGRIPLAMATRMAAACYHHDPLDWALNGGEDYELLFTCARRHAEAVMAIIHEKTKLPCTIIGEIKERRAGVKLLTTAGRKQPLPKGFEHGG